MRNANKDKALGTLFGGACGDALGVSLEFSATRAPFPDLHAGPHTTITGNGPFSVAKGQITDDTMMAVCLWRSLNARTRFDARDVARRYAEWRRHTFDIGGQTSGALAEFERHGDAQHCGFASWSRGGRNAAGNGSLMRTWAIPAYDARTNVISRSIADSMITHADPLCLIAVASYNAAIAYAINTPEATARGMIAEAYRTTDAVTPWMTENYVPIQAEKAQDAIKFDLDCALLSDPQFGNGVSLSGGFVRTAFRLAFWHLVHAPDYRSAVVSAVNCGGDADTNGAITGALCGALRGLSGIPADWVQTVIDCKTRHGGALDTEYHPRVFAD